jgi:hypothetical protein
MTLYLHRNHAFGFFAVVCMFFDALIPALAPAPQLGWLRWRVPLILFAVIALVCLIVQLFVLSKQEHDREERERLRVEQDAERDGLIQRMVEKFEGSSASQKAAQIPAPNQPEVSAGMTIDDPRIYLGIEEPKEGMFARTPFILSNHGKTTAHNVSIQPFKLKRKNVTFPEVSSIAAGEKAQALPSIEGAGHMQAQDIFHWLVQDWDGNGELTDDWPIDLRVKFSDPLGKRFFESQMTLVFHPIKHIMYRQRGPGKTPPFISKDATWEIKGIRFELVHE